LPLFVEMPVPSNESESLCTWVFGISILSLFIRFPDWILELFLRHVVFSLFYYYIILNCKVSMFLKFKFLYYLWNIFQLSALFVPRCSYASSSFNKHYFDLSNQIYCFLIKQTVILWQIIERHDWFEIEIHLQVDSIINH